MPVRLTPSPAKSVMLPLNELEIVSYGPSVTGVEILYENVSGAVVRLAAPNPYRMNGSGLVVVSLTDRLKSAVTMSPTMLPSPVLGSQVVVSPPRSEEHTSEL